MTKILFLALLLIIPSSVGCTVENDSISYAELEQLEQEIEELRIKIDRLEKEAQNQVRQDEPISPSSDERSLMEKWHEYIESSEGKTVISGQTPSADRDSQQNILGTRPDSVVPAPKPQAPTTITTPIPTGALRKCVSCNGTGHKQCLLCGGTGNSMMLCYACNGSGTNNFGMRCISCYGRGFMPCVTCNGTGNIICNICNGTGVW